MRFQISFYQHRSLSGLRDQLNCIVESFVDKGAVFFGDTVINGGTLWGGKIENDSPSSLNAIRLLKDEADWGAEVIEREIRDFLTRPFRSSA